mmetsp:Transcript_41178/g.49469  ORF Transcript_41178/g.49469 Transcript_41178/m.49469 type:complete len:223 (+) Transcript_41178:80-748(+)
MLETRVGSESNFYEMSVETLNGEDLCMLDDVDLDSDFLEDCFDEHYTIRRKSQSGCASRNVVEKKNSDTEPTRRRCSTNSRNDMNYSCTPEVDTLDNIRTETVHGTTTKQLENQDVFSGNSKKCPQDESSCVAEFQVKYNNALNNLASSMQRSQLSRAKILSRRRNQVFPINNTHIVEPNHRSYSRLTELLSGRSSTLTAALQQSRKQLESYVDSTYINAPI